jgi:hypothetical protein
MKTFRLALSISTLLAALPCFAGETYFLQVPALVDPAAPIPNAVKSQCEVEKMLADDVLAKLNDRYGPVQSVTAPEQAGDGKLIQLTILSVHGLGGGGWSGTKSVAIRVDTLKGGTRLDSVYLDRSSGGGVLGGVTGTCGILDRIGDALGRDLANWLQRLDRQANAGKAP